MVKQCKCGEVYNQPSKREVFLYIASRLAHLYYGCQCGHNRIKWTLRDFSVTFNIGKNTALRMLKLWRAD